MHRPGTLTEGEKACDALRAAEPALLVLGTVTAAGSIPAPEVLQTVVDAALPIYLWPDVLSVLEGVGLYDTDSPARA